MSYISFYRGLKSKYDASLYSNGVYFATDAKEIIVNGISYIGALADNALIKLVAISEDGSKLIFTYTDDTVKEFDLNSADVTELQGQLTVVSEKVDALTTTSNEHSNKISTLETSVNNLTVKSVKSDDKIISTDESGVLSTSVALDYNSVDKKIQLTGIEGAVVSELDASEFIKDGMIDSVVYNSDTKIITITWNTAAGKDATEINISNLVDVYTASNGLELSDNAFSVKLDTTTSDALTVSAAGLKLQVTESLKSDLGLNVIIESIDDHETRIKEIENSLVWNEI